MPSYNFAFVCYEKQTSQIMNTITQLKLQLEASKAEIESLRSDIYIKDQKIKCLEIKEKYGNVKRQSAKRHLGLEVTQLEVKSLNEKLDVLREELNKKDDELAFQKFQNERLCDDLRVERERMNYLTLESFERRYMTPDGDNHMIDRLSIRLKSTRERLQKKEDELTTLLCENKSITLKSNREMKSLENEKNELKRGNEIMRNQMKDLQKEMNSNEMKVKDTIRQWSNRNKDLQIDVNLLKMRIEELEYQLDEANEKCANDEKEWNASLESMGMTIKMLELN